MGDLEQTSERINFIEDLNNLNVYHQILSLTYI